RASEPFFGHAKSVPLDRLPQVNGEAQRAIVRAVHVALKSGADETNTRRFHFNTTTARLDELVNLLTTATRDSRYWDDPAVLYAIHSLPILLAPFAPHMAEELWSRMGYATSVHLERWIEPDQVALAVREITLVVQVNGKVRARISAEPGIDEDRAFSLALAE